MKEKKRIVGILMRLTPWQIDFRAIFSPNWHLLWLLMNMDKLIVFYDWDGSWWFGEFYKEIFSYSYKVSKEIEIMWKVVEINKTVSSVQFITINRDEKFVLNEPIVAIVRIIHLLEVLLCYWEILTIARNGYFPPIHWDFANIPWIYVCVFGFIIEIHWKWKFYWDITRY